MKPEEIFELYKPGTKVLCLECNMIVYVYYVREVVFSAPQAGECEVQLVWMWGENKHGVNACSEVHLRHNCIPFGKGGGSSFDEAIENLVHTLPVWTSNEDMLRRFPDNPSVVGEVTKGSARC